MHRLQQSTNIHPESLHDRIVKLTAIRVTLGDKLARHPGDRALADLYRKVCEQLCCAQSRAEKLLRSHTAPGPAARRVRL